MSDLDKKFISVKYYDSCLNYKQEAVKEEVIEILNFTPTEAFEAEKKGFFYIPGKITYFRKTSENTANILNGLTRNKRKKLQKSIKNSENFELVKECPLTESTFLEWYKEVYVPAVESKKYGLVLADEKWWIKDTDCCEKAGIFSRKNGRIVSGIVARSYEMNSFLPKRMSISYSAGMHEFRSLGLMDYLNIQMIAFAKKRGYEYIFRGKDTNLYGKHLSPGIPVFKTALGYEIMALKSSPDILLKFNDFSEFGDVIFFVSYSKEPKKLIGNLIFKKEPEKVEAYKKPFIYILRVFRYDGRKLNFIEELRT